MTADERRAHNEALFRDLNERVSEIDARLENGMSSPRPLEFLCECGDLECATRFPMMRDDYEGVRRHETYFVVIPDHVDEQIEEVVEIKAGYVVVSKNGVAADVARDTDPRE